MRAVAAILTSVGVVAVALLLHGAAAVRAGAVARRVSTVSSSSLRTRADRPRPERGGRAPRVVTDLLHDLAVPADPVAVWWGGVAVLAVLVVAGVVVGGPGLGLVAGVGAVLVPVVVVGLGRGRRGRLVDRQLPVALDRMGRALRAGTSLRAAFGAVATGAPAPLADELVRLDAELAAGGPLVDVLAGWGARCPTPGVRLLVAAATLGHEAGGAQARAIDGVAATLRERQAVQREARALASQARASAAVVVLAPVGFAVFSAATDPEVLAFLLGTGPGLVCLVLAFGLDVAAGVWMARITGSIR